MTGPSPAGRGPVYFCYAWTTAFSGQKAATELVIHGLSARGWDCQELPQPVLDRGGGRFARLRYLAGVLLAWLRAGRLLGARGGGLWVGLGQTRASFVRDAIPLLFGRLGLGRSRVVVSLNGSLFMHWSDDSLDARVFRFLLNNAGTIAVVGERQWARLIALGVPPNRATVVVNSCALEPASTYAVAAKHRVTAEHSGAVRCLHLSNLIDTKGFPEYLEALHRLAALGGRRIDAVLCGRVVASEFSSRFRDARAAEAWIDAQVVSINRSARVCVRWIRGAAGADKAALFRGADIFVLPTYYSVEAQPLVLLEAMASGCAIITTAAGEIPTILDERSAVFVSAASTEMLAAVMQTLVEDAEARARLALAAHARFVDCYRVDRHLDAWENILDPSRAATNGAS